MIWICCYDYMYVCMLCSLLIPEFSNYSWRYHGRVIEAPMAWHFLWRCDWSPASPFDMIWLCALMIWLCRFMYVCMYGGAYGSILALMFMYDYVYVWWMWVGASLLLHSGASYSMWYREVSPLRILWQVIMDYVCMYVWDLSSTLAGRLVAFLWFVCPFNYLVWTLLCWYVLITFSLWLCLCDISWYFVSLWLMIFIQCMLISYAFDRWYSFQQKLMMSCFLYLYTFYLSVCFVISVHSAF